MFEGLRPRAVPGGRARPLAARAQARSGLCKDEQGRQRWRAQSGPGLGFIETLPSFDGLGPLGFGQARSIVIHQDLEFAGAVGARGAHPDVGLGPFAGVVEQVPNHLLEVLLLALEFEPRTQIHRELQRLVLIDTVERPLESLEHTVDVGDVADCAGAGGDPCPVEMMRDLVSHQLRLLDDFVGERAVFLARRRHCSSTLNPSFLGRPRSRTMAS